jgi:quercetin dioxygenase-like cupin family protein
VQQIWEGVVARVIGGKGVTLALIELESNTAVPEHSHENEQLGVLIQGTLTFTVAGETRTLQPGGTWRIEPHLPHSVVAGPEGAVLAEVFAPARDDWDAVERQPASPPSWPRDQ